MAGKYTAMPPNCGGGGRHGSGHSAKNSKPSYMSHVPSDQLSAHTKHAGSENKMTHQNLMSHLGGGDISGEA